MNRLYQNIMDSSPLSTPYIGKKLISDKQRVAPICPHLLHGLDIVLRGWLMGIVYIICLDILIEHLDPGFLVIGDQAALETDLSKPVKQRYRPVVRRRAMGD